MVELAVGLEVVISLAPAASIDVLSNVSVGLDTVVNDVARLLGIVALVLLALVVTISTGAKLVALLVTVTVGVYSEIERVAPFAAHSC